jgi:hypothetical protein
MTATRIHFDRINDTAVGALPAVLARILPGGKSIGREFVALNPTRADHRPGSFKVRLVGQRAGYWADFATGDKGGDPVSLVAYIEGVSQSEAARILAQVLDLLPDEDHLALNIAAKPQRRPVAAVVHEYDADAIALLKPAERLPGTLASQYLKVRRIGIEAPPSLRYLSDANYFGRARLPRTQLASWTSWP